MKSSTFESEVFRFWAEFLPCSDPDPESNFFHAGGTWETADAMLQAAAERFHVPPLDRAYFLRAPTYARLLAMLQGLPQEDESPEITFLQLGTDAALPAIYYIPAGWDEAATIRRVAVALGPRWTVATMRPLRQLMEPTEPYSLEKTAERLSGCIADSHQRGRPFVLAGFCIGGLLAYQASHTMAASGCRGLVLFDTPMPGYPYPYAGTGYFGEVAQYLSDRRAAAGTAACRVSLRRTLARKVAWHVVSRTRPLLTHVWNHRLVRRVTDQCRLFEVPHFTRIRSSRLPVLHFMGVDEADFNRRAARSQWTHFLRGGQTILPLPGDHNQIFFRPNLPRIASGIQHWVHQLPLSIHA